MLHQAEGSDEDQYADVDIPKTNGVHDETDERGESQSP